MPYNTPKTQNSMRLRYIISIIVIILVVLIVNVFQFFALDKLFTFTNEKAMIRAAEEIEVLDINDKDFMRIISDIESNYSIYVEIYEPRDILVYTTNSNEWIFNSQYGTSPIDPKPRIMKILSHKDIDSDSYLEKRQEYYANGQYYVYGITGEDRCIEIFTSSEAIRDNANIASWTILIVSIFISLIFIITIYVFLNTFVVPLKKIIKVTKQITRTDFSQQCPQFAVSELDELSESVNVLSSTLDKALSELRTKNEELKNDIEKKQRSEEMRKHFIANASHELKTPIAIIQGYAEAIMFDINDCPPEEYCKIIIEETEKMNHLVMRMLEMTKYEYGYILKCSDFRISTLVQKHLSSRLMHITNKGITVETDIDEGFIGYGDFDILSDVFDNYMSNAEAHANFEKIIRISCRLVDKNYRISVFNTGSPIDSEDIESIWDSFYRADKARSRTQSRFGLGLALVAASQNLHNQKYGVINHPDGVEFWFDISGYNIT